MVSDQDVYRAAEGLMRNRGDQAASECAELVERWEGRGQPEAAALWRRVMAAIQEISRQRPN